MKKAYLANQFGFSETGRYLLTNLIKPKLATISIEVLDPFVECGKEFNYDLKQSDPYSKHVAFFKKFSARLAIINNDLIHKSDLLLALFDGGHAVDDGVASEVGYFAGVRPKCPIFGLRSDFRCGENIGTTINPQILGYITMSGGKLYDGACATENWVAGIETWCLQNPFLKE